MKKEVYQFDKTHFLHGMRDGLPIGLGYFAVSFSLGIIAKKAGLTALQGFLTSALINASAGEYACFTAIAADAAYLELIILTLIANGRYLLMSCALSQRFHPKMPFYHRLLVGFDITDEIWAVTIGHPGYVRPHYTYGVILAAAPFWSVGTALGIMAGNILPARIVSALSVALYGMFIAIIIPPAKKDKLVAALVSISFILSYISSIIPITKQLSSGTQAIILTVVISAAAAILFPVKGTSEIDEIAESEEQNNEP